MLERAGEVRTEEEAAADPQRIDVWFVPDPKRRVEYLGLLGRIACEPCMLEPFYRTPDLERIRACVRKQLAWHYGLQRRAPRSGPPPLWVISSGRPEGAVVGLGFVPRASWLLGVYALPKAWGVFLVVLRPSA